MQSDSPEYLNHLLNTIIKALEDIKAEDITIIDTSKCTPLFSYLIVASGKTNRQVKALAKNVTTEVKQAGFEVVGTEGLDSGEWALVDTNEIIVHIMTPSVREYYDIETLWKNKPDTK